MMMAFAFRALLLLAQTDPLDPPVAAAPGAFAYLDGLDLLDAGRAADAVKPLTEAVDAAPANPSYRAARGVALLLSERLAEGMADLGKVYPSAKPDPFVERLLSFGIVASGTASAVDNLKSSTDVHAWVMRTAWAYFKGGEGRERARQEFPRIGAWFSENHAQTIEVARIAYARGVQRLDRSPAEAAADLERARALVPQDWSVLYYVSQARLLAGDPKGAREGFTLALCWKTRLWQGYLGRARAAAQLGDARRAESDLAQALRLNPQIPGDLSEAVRKEIERAKSETGDLKALYPMLLKATNDRAPLDDMIKLSIAVRRAMNARRRLADETYQDRRRELEDAVLAAPASAEALADLGDFLLAEADVVQEDVIPRRPDPLRPHPAAVLGMERARAAAMYERALAADPRHARALLGRAVSLLGRRNEDAETRLRKVLEAGVPTTPQTVAVTGRLRSVAGELRNEATQLETPKITFEVRHERDEYVTYRITTPPSAQELAQAAELRQQAKRFDGYATTMLEQAVKAAGETALGLYFRGALLADREDAAGAKEALKESVKRDTAFFPAFLLLADVHETLTFREAMAEARSDGYNLRQTTAGPWLRWSWSRLLAKEWESSKRGLFRAIAIDPSDARIAAYLGIQAEGTNEWQTAIQFFHLAIAQEEARARERGTTFASGGRGILDPEEFGLSILARIKMARYLLPKYPEIALGFYRANIDLDARMPLARWTKPVHSAFIPEPSMNTIPKHVPIALSLMSREAAATCLVRMKKYQEGLAEFRQADQLRELKAPNGQALIESDGRRAPYVALALARAWLEAGDVGRARTFFQMVTKIWTDDAPDEAEYKELAAKLGGAAPQAPKTRGGFDATFEGSWTTTGKNAQGTFQLGYDVDSTGSYRFSIGGKPAAEGRLEASNGRLRFVTKERTDEGSYKVVDAETLEVTVGGVKYVWKRKKG